MTLMRADHPDVLEFIEAKCKECTFENFNCSIALTDEFMTRLVSNDPSPWICKFNGESSAPRYMSRGAAGRVIAIATPELMDQNVHHAWANGEPDCVVIDTVNETNPLPRLAPIECCNPCGEQFLHSGDAINFGSIN
jgi:ribonucleoside-diphosphate reductase alpha chain